MNMSWGWRCCCCFLLLVQSELDFVAEHRAELKIGFLNAVLDSLEISVLWNRSIYRSLYLWLCYSRLWLTGLSIRVFTIRAQCQLLVVEVGTVVNYQCMRSWLQLCSHCAHACQTPALLLDQHVSHHWQRGARIFFPECWSTILLNVWNAELCPVCWNAKNACW